MSTEFDFTELTRLAADLGDAAETIGKPLRQAVEVTARHVKDDWNENLYTEGHAKLTGHSITYDIEGTASKDGSAITADIGAVTGSGKQAGIVRLLENGSINNPPHGAGSGALKANEDDFERGIDLAVGDALKQVGL